MLHSKSRKESDLLKWLSEIFLKKVKDKRFYTVTFIKIELSDNFRYAKVFFDSWKKYDVKTLKQLKILKKLLNEKSSFFTFLLSKTYNLRNAPKLFFDFEKDKVLLSQII